MNKFFPGFAMDIQPADGSMDVLTLRIRTDISGEFHLPSNVGYGPYYALPVVTAALSAKPGGLLILDSPEAHLHPRCQNEMAKFKGAIKEWQGNAKLGDNYLDENALQINQPNVPPLDCSHRKEIISYYQKKMKK